ncbi:MAG: hypothetical protein AB8B87_13995 [Granulosicoccus sp.]
MEGDATTCEKERRRQLEIYEAASLAYLRAMSRDASLTVTYGQEDPLDELDVVTPALSSLDDKRLLTLHRGLLDSYVFMRQFHDADLHSRNAPTDETSVRLFNLFERERFEALGGEIFAGVKINLTALWAGSYTPELIERLAGVDQLEWVVSYLCREQLHTAPPRESVAPLMDGLRDPVEALIGEHLIEMKKNRYDQLRYSQEVLRLINRLGFPIDSEPAASDDANNVDDTNTEIQSLDDQSSEDDNPDEEQQSGKGVDTAPSDSRDLDQAAMVRNAEPENRLEPALAEFNQLLEHDARQKSAEQYNTETMVAYNVYDKTADEEISALELVDQEELHILKSSLQERVEQHAHLIRRLATRLQRLLMARQNRSWLDEQDEGELDTRRLPRLITDPGSPASYRIETEAPVRSTTVTILVDNSRSMLGRPIELAAVCAELLTRTLERCGVSSEVLGFTTVSMYGGATKARWQSTGKINNPGRLNSVRHIVYKSAQMPWRRARERFAVMLKPEVLKQNIDGEALLWAHARLLKRTDDKRLLIVVSDGAPSDSATLTANNKDLLVKHLRSVVKQIEIHSPVDLMAIGIGHDVSGHYANSMTINNVDELGTALLNHLSRMLLDSDLRLVV